MGRVTLLVLACLAIACLAECPKESFWRNKVCYGTDLNVATNLRDRDRTGDNVHPITELDPSCCRCPRSARFVGRHCAVRRRWTRHSRATLLPDSCCNGERRKRPFRSPSDPARVEAGRILGSEAAMGGVAPIPASVESASADAPVPLMHAGIARDPFADQTQEPFASRALLQVDRCRALNGQCMEVSACRGTPIRGRCSGSGSIQCCIPGAAGAVPAAAPAAAPPARGGGGGFHARYRRTNINWSDLSNGHAFGGAHEGSNQASKVRGLCPNFYSVWNSYPSLDIPSDDLLARIGMSWITNTCTVRGSLALEGIGIYPGEIGRTKWRMRGGGRILIRVAEMRPFLLATFGAPIARGSTRPVVPMIYEEDGIDERSWLPPAEIMNKAGMIVFTDCVFSDATGHVDVWDGTEIREHDYFHRCRTAEIYDVCNPLPNPNYSSWLQYLRTTRAT